MPKEKLDLVDIVGKPRAIELKKMSRNTLLDLYVIAFLRIQTGNETVDELEEELTRLKEQIKAQDFCLLQARHMLDALTKTWR